MLKRILSTLLVFAVILSCVGWLPVRAQSAETELPDASVTDSSELQQEQTQIVRLSRLYDEEGDDLNRLIYLNSDGSRTMELYDFPVKYRDSDGTIRDISLELAQSTQPLARYFTAQGRAVTSFPEQLTDGIRLTDGDISIKLTPCLPLTATAGPQHVDGAGSVQQLDSNTVSYCYDAETTLEYSLTYTGFKEDIVVNSYTGQTEYAFVLETGGLAPLQRDGSYYLADDTGTIRASIGDIIVFSADERNNTTGTIRMETITENQRYRLTIVLDNDYLSDPATLYPIRIDPTIDINYDTDGSGAIEDVTIYSNVTPDGASTSLFVGLRETRGISRILMRFPSLDLSGMTGATVQSANVTLRDLMCEGTTLSVYCYPFTGATWTENTASWSMTQTWGSQLDQKDISYSNGAALSPKHRYSFDITAAVQGWVNGTLSKDKGLIFKSGNTVETGSTYQQRQFASYNRTNYQPTFSMTYILNGSITSVAGNNYINEGQAMLLTAHMNGNVTWISSDTSVATVNASGVVSGLKAGSVTITASCAGYADATFKVWVTVPNGVYYIKNVSSGLCLQGITQVSMASVQTDESARITQLWKITYIQNGFYVIRPMQNTAQVLTLDSNKNATRYASTADNSQVTSSNRWTITRSSSGLTIKRNGASSETLTYSGTTACAGTWSSASTHQWTLQSVIGVFLRDTGTYQIVTAQTPMYVIVGSQKTLSQMNLKYEIYGGASNRYWLGGSSYATISTAGTVTGVKCGQTTISLSAVINNVSYQASYTLYVLPFEDGTYWVRNRQLGNYMQIDNDAAVSTSGAILELFDYDGSNVQQWVFTHVGNGYYSIKSTASNLYVTVQADHLNQGNYALTQTAYSGLTSQKWKISISSHGSYVLRPMSGTSWCMSAGEGIGSSGRNVEQRTYSDNEDYLDEWYINSYIRIGLSTDDCDSGGCSHSSLNSCLYGTKFYDSLQFAKTKVHHYNKGTAHAASPNDFATNGAIDSNVNFMVYIGHGHPANNAYGNHFHYDCGRFDVDHSACDSGLCANGVYTSTAKFGSATSQLRCVWLYTCNFMNENDYVSKDDLKSMLNGAHIVIGYGTKAYLLQNVAIDYAERLSKGEPIIDALGDACVAHESFYESQVHMLRSVCYESARYESIFTPYQCLISENVEVVERVIPKLN